MNDSLAFLLAIIEAKTGSWVSTDEIILCVLEISGYFMSFNEKGWYLYLLWALVVINEVLLWQCEVLTATLKKFQVLLGMMPCRLMCSVYSSCSSF
jgi:hypothetical protein